VRAWTIAAATAACVGLTALAALVLGWSFERAAFLAPVIVAGAGAVAGLAVLWTRVAWESLRKARHPRLVVALSVAALLLLVGLSILGLKLPKE
jgi:hypothetical protein